MLAFKIPGDYRERATPVPIPNTEVKPLIADGTMWFAAWESRTLPGFLFLDKGLIQIILFCSGNFLFPKIPKNKFPMKAIHSSFGYEMVDSNLFQ